MARTGLHFLKITLATLWESQSGSKKDQDTIAVVQGPLIKEEIAVVQVRMRQLKGQVGKEKRNQERFLSFSPEQLNFFLKKVLFAKETSNVRGSILDFEYVRLEMPFRHSDSDIKYETG